MYERKIVRTFVFLISLLRFSAAETFLTLRGLKAISCNYTRRVDVRFTTQAEVYIIVF